MSSKRGTREASDIGVSGEFQFPSLLQAFLRELQWLQSQHEKRVLDRLDAHQKHLDILLADSRACSPAGSPELQPSGLSQEPAAGHGDQVLRSCTCALRHHGPTLPGAIPPFLEAAGAGDMPPVKGWITSDESLRPRGGSSLGTRASRPANPGDTSPLRTGRTETWRTWMEDSTLEATALYKKKKVVESTQRRWAEAQGKTHIRGSFSKSALAVVSHPRFEMTLACLIMANACCIGVQADWSLRHVDRDIPLLLKAIDYLFSIIFALELATRILAEGRSFVTLKNRNIHWNILDALLVVLAATGDVLGLFVAWGTNVSVLRLLRVLRLTRAIRLIRVLRFFKDLRVMIAGIAQSSKSLLWASLLLLLIIYMYAICVSQIVSDHLAALQKEGRRGGPEALLLEEHYGTLVLTVYTLFGSISGGYDWAGIVEPLLEISPVMGLLHVVYVAFAVFCVLNVITGVFVENAVKINSDDEEKAVLDMLESRRQWIQEIKNLFQIFDIRDDGYLDLSEFSAIIKDVRVQAIFRRLGVDVEAESAAPLFQLLDFEGTGTVSLDDFAEGIQKIRGNARSFDVCQLLHDSKVLKRQTAEVMHLLEGALVLMRPDGVGSSSEV